MSAGIFSSTFKFYWLGISILAVIALALWYCKCRGRYRRRQEELLARHQVLVQQLRSEVPEPPSAYRSDAPPAYDDVINKPEDYPIYQAQGTNATTTSSPVSHSNVTQDLQSLPSYEEVVRMSDYFTDASHNVSEERTHTNVITVRQHPQQSLTTSL